MEINWDEVNVIIEKKSSKGSYMVKPEEMDSIDLAKISFLITELQRFPDNLKTVTESGALLRSHLTEKYCELSSESIARLVDRFCFINR